MSEQETQVVREALEYAIQARQNLLERWTAKRGERKQLTEWKALLKKLEAISSATA